MKQFEQIWRHLLFSAFENGERRTSLLHLSGELEMPISSVHKALVRPREIGCVEVTNRGLVVLDPRRLLYLWAAHRRPAQDEILRISVDMSTERLESELGPEFTPTAYSAYSRAFGRTVADYTDVFAYVAPGGEAGLRSRFATRPATSGGGSTLVLLQADRLLPMYGPTPPMAQVFVDLFNLPGWQAPRFLDAVERRLLQTEAA